MSVISAGFRWPAQALVSATMTSNVIIRDILFSQLNLNPGVKFWESWPYQTLSGADVLVILS
jgi:hypothetical protein